MKQKIVALLLILSITISGCGSSGTSADTNSTSNDNAISDESTENSLSDLEAIGDVEVEENLFSVELTIPSDYVGDTTQEELEAEANEKGYKSVTLNDDGSATYVMTKSQHEDMMNEMAENINSSLDDMIASENYPNFTSIEANDTFTEFTVTTKSAELDLNEAFSVMTFYMYGGMYNIFNGTPVDNVHVDFVNADSGEIISSSDSKDAE